ncbi:MAG: DUF4317 domain-containing protein [Lachnospiraceae bacterium]|nr:DUF4317 domain-containing protein [Lachnospiraceae bacterium]
MINRDDMLELTRRMTPSRSCFTRIAGAYTDQEREIGDTFNTRFLKLSSSDQARNLNLAKTIPFSRTNEQLKEYRFNKSGAGSMWQILMTLKDCGLRNDALLDVFYEQVLNNFDGGNEIGTYIYMYHGTYDIPAKGSDGGYIYDGDEVYDFIICAAGGLVDEYEPDEPQFGFLYPAFVNRSGDENRIDIFHVYPEYPESDLIKVLLG